MGALLLGELGAVRAARTTVPPRLYCKQLWRDSDARLDASGQIVAQRVEWLGGSDLPGFSTTYYEVPIRQQASRYRVSVFAFDFVQSARIESP